MRFDELFYNDDLLDALWDMHFDECTPIQQEAIPKILDGHDLIAVAQTGTGKTAAYVLPILEMLYSGSYPNDKINCIIVAPTRELAQQIDRQIQGFSYFMPVSSIPVYGGTDGNTFQQQRNAINMGADILICTPGRLISHLNMGYVDLSQVSFLILDEADRMLDMGFYDDIMKIVDSLPTDRQTLLFSATMPPRIRQLAGKVLREPEEVILSVSKPADNVDQKAYICYEAQKTPLLRQILEGYGSDSRTIVFASSKQKVRELARTLRGRRLKVGEIHSDLAQEERDESLQRFRSGHINVLVATDIVARGIDIDDISLVVNFDVPGDAEDYIHRVGRTARAGAGGNAITFVGERDFGKFRGIEKFLATEIAKAPLPENLGEALVFTERKRSSGKAPARKRNGRGKPTEKNGKSTPKDKDRQHGDRRRRRRKPVTATDKK